MPKKIVKYERGSAKAAEPLASSCADHVRIDWDITDESAPGFIHNKPEIPAAQVQSDWNEVDISSPAFIKNKPTEKEDEKDISVKDIKDWPDAFPPEPAEVDKVGGVKMMNPIPDLISDPVAADINKILSELRTAGILKK